MLIMKAVAIWYRSFKFSYTSYPNAVFPVLAYHRLIAVLQLGVFFNEVANDPGARTNVFVLFFAFKKNSTGKHRVRWFSRKC